MAKHYPAGHEFGIARIFLPAFSIILLAFSVAADPVIEQSRFQLDVSVDDGLLEKEYDSDDEARVVTDADRFLSTHRPSISEGAGGCPLTDSATSVAQIAGKVTPTQITVSGSASKVWRTSHNEFCDFASINFDAQTQLNVSIDAGADAADGKEYDVNISGTLLGDEVRGWLEGLDLGSNINDRASFFGSSDDTFSRSYTLDMSGATAGQLDFFVEASAGIDSDSPIERETTYTGDEEFRLRVVIFDPDDTPPPEDCHNGFDDDFDGDVDSKDTECPSPEVCDNGLDDDLDGLIDLADIDCAAPAERVGLAVRCMHEPVYPQNGDQVTIRAMAFTEASLPIVADEVQIYLDDMTVPAAAGTAIDRIEHTFTADNGTFSYGCRAHRNAVPYSETATSWAANDVRLRTADTGIPDAGNPPWINGVPIILNGQPKEKIDIIFFADDTEYPLGALDPAFQKDVYDLIYAGYFRIPFFIQLQHYFNFWLAFDGDANAGLAAGDNPLGLCARDAPTGFTSRYSWADTAAIVHQSACRDNAGDPGLFTIEASSRVSKQVVAHETGHRPFGLGDEYCCDGGYLTSSKGLLSSNYDPTYPNIFKKRKQCEKDADGRAYGPQDCRRMMVGEDLDTERWFLEPFHRNNFKDEWWLDPLFDPNDLSYRDLMQQTGRRCRWDEIFDDDGNPTGEFQWFCSAQYNIGNSERDRMTWMISKCLSGEC